MPLKVSQDQDSRVVDDCPEPGPGLCQNLGHPGPGTHDALLVGDVEVGDDDQPAGVGADGLEVLRAQGGVLGVTGSHHHQPGGVTELGQAQSQPWVVG